MRRGSVVLLALVVGFFVGAWWEPFEPKASLPPITPINLGRPGRYVALGDSYAAGEGLKPFQAGTVDISEGGDRCHRSENYAYPELLKFVQPPTHMDFRACSGAVTEDIFDAVQEHNGVPDRLGVQAGQGVQAPPGKLGPDVSLVTLTMGGNDLHFANVLTFCLKTSDCPDEAYGGAPTLSDWIDAELGTLQGQLLDLYQRLRQDAPNARILVLGYPALFPVKAPSFLDIKTAECRLLFSPLAWDASERSAIRQWDVELNRIIQADAHAAGVDYVDIFPFFAEHEPCGPAGEWIRFVGLSSSSVRDGSFHPREEGQAMMARIISCYLHVYSNVRPGVNETQDFAMPGCVGSGAEGD